MKHVEQRKGYINMVSHKDDYRHNKVGKFCVSCAKDLSAIACVDTSCRGKASQKRHKMKKKQLGTITHQYMKKRNIGKMMVTQWTKRTIEDKERQNTEKETKREH